MARGPLSITSFFRFQSAPLGLSMGPVASLGSRPFFFVSLSTSVNANNKFSYLLCRCLVSPVWGIPNIRSACRLSFPYTFVLLHHPDYSAADANDRSGGVLGRTRGQDSLPQPGVHAVQKRASVLGCVFVFSTSIMLSGLDGGGRV